MLYNSCYQQKKVFPRHRNRQHAKRAKPPLGTTGVPTFFFLFH
jgi:hypothetical protein